MASVAAIVLALAGPSMPMNDATMSVVFVMDKSGSINPSTRTADEDWVRQAVGQMKEGDKAAVVTFAGESTVSRQMGGEKQLSLFRLGSEAEAGTDLATALAPRLGSSAHLGAPQGGAALGRLGYRRPGRGGRARAARRHAAGRRAAPRHGRAPEVLVESVSIPSYVREGDSFDVSAVVGSNHEGSAQLSVSVDGKQTGGWSVQLSPGANLVTVAQKPLPLGFHSIRVQLGGGGDTVADNNRADGFVVVKEKGHVLLVNGQESGSRLKGQLEGSGLRVDEIGTSSFPTQIADLLPFDSVVLNDVSGRALTLDQMKMLESFVKDHGRGLFVVGGQNSYGLGDYSNRLLEDVLPVSSDSPLTKERGDMALMLLIDRSGSMDESSGGVSKMAMAREAAIQAIGALKPNDQIGVIAFDTDPTG